MQISPRWAVTCRRSNNNRRRLSRSKSGFVWREARSVSATMIVGRFTQAEYFYLRNMKTQIEKSTPGLSDLYRNSFGATKARHFIFAYTKNIQSVNRHFELPSETNTFLPKYVITLALRPQCYLPCKMKTEPDTNTASPWNFRTTVLRQANWQNRDKNKQTNKKPAIMFSFSEKSGKKIRKERKKAGSTIQVFDTFVLETYFVTEVF